MIRKFLLLLLIVSFFIILTPHLNAQDITGFKEIKMFTLGEGENIKELMVLTSEVCVTVQESKSSGIWYIVTEKDKKESIIANGKREGWFNGIRGFVFSSDGRRYAYISEKIDILAPSERGKFYVVLDGKECESFDYVEKVALGFSPDNKRFVYIASNNGKWDEEGNYFGGKWFIVLDGERGNEFDEIDPWSLLFSPDSKRFAYSARISDKWYAVIDGVKSEPFDEVDWLEFSPDSNRFVYRVRYMGKFYTVLDGKRDNMKGFDDISLFRFSPDSKRFVYIGIKGEKKYVILDGKESEPFDHIDFVAFDSTSNKFVYRANIGGNWDEAKDSYTGGEWYMVVNNEKSSPYDEMSNLVYLENGNFFAIGRKGRDIYSIEK
ncbi:MAG: hypothetical protein N2380_09035 [bacterium]|nr:hypothetical protein [bacterium]